MFITIFTAVLHLKNNGQKAYDQSMKDCRRSMRLRLIF
jgi:hypothetical protein